MPHLNAFNWSLIIGIIATVIGLSLLAGGQKITPLLLALPRHKWTGRILAVLAWIGTGWAIMVMPLSMLTPYKQFVPYIIIISIPLSWFWLEDLLTCRATAGLLMLFPTPLLLCLRSHHSPWRLVLISFAYLALTAGMVVMLYPWHMRRACHALAKNSVTRIATGAATTLIGILIIAIGLLAFQ
ncbi:MAG: hypothetical protein GX230_05560 [Lentisphaerae bacterium]|nr:hypothetical protein [Lentisphaerota bacterium]